MSLYIDKNIFFDYVNYTLFNEKTLSDSVKLVDLIKRNKLK
ncbi:MAG: hypothetical protein WC356_01075 [Candidatus Micrarchaeia archaeon]|jgi:hypothetical protein